MLIRAEHAAIEHDLDRLPSPQATVDGMALTRLTRLAGNLLGVPVQLVSRLVTVDTAEPTYSSHLCAHVVESGAPLIVEDSRRSPLAAIRAAKPNAYAGLPLTLRDGHTVGALCASDSTPRAWSSADLEVLGDLAAVAVDMLQTRHADRAREGRDALTGLPSRSLFAELTRNALAETARTHVTGAMLAVGLDGFRLVNDAFGHDTGDAVLVAVAQRLAAGLRGEGAVCRVGGDEFLLLCEGLDDDADGARLAERVHHELTSVPIAAGGDAILIRATVGVALADTPIPAEQLIDAALEALIRRKAGALTATGAPDPERRGRAAARLRVHHALAGAHERGEFHLAYQPLFDIRTGELASLEALLRWTHPDLGRIAPDDFVPAAERSGAIVAIGEWTIAQAARDLARWRANPATRELTVAVNLAPTQLRTAGLPGVVREALEDNGLPGGALTLEITERVLLDDRSGYARAMHRLRDLGARIALDDFGTGYSALGYLTSFPFDTIKLDRSFVAALDGDPRAEALVEAITTMATKLGLSTVAEGVETAAQLECVAQLGCDLAQGYHLARPLTATALDERASFRPGATR
ncbi:EAL domain-containing protein [Solirubrobacter phytolaccae]|uniref:EAL domain-containing protein n=1 Tax=Solirubrobacter phytolaccae TaxID=1404360 RepID=A0A9X3NDI5_9ACTN|nr:GGDEF domain-containing phosphodiesterase [Solirubrobacter phytolaccae]MDA0182895.1 EAL domain-containing protein [Solirubrobacter phytolaccae]